MADHSLTLLEKLLSKVQYDPNGGCWLYDGYWMPAGYGQFYFAHGCPVLAHRASWILHYGPIPAGLQVHHHCDVPPCFRPDHLFIGTQQDNIDDMIAKNRGAAPPIFRGEANNLSTLQRHQVIEIRRLYAAGGVTQQTLAERFGVTQGGIAAVVNRKSWAWL